MNDLQKKESLIENNVTFLVIVAVLSAMTYIPAVFPISLIRLIPYGLVALVVSMRAKRSGSKTPIFLVIGAAVVDVVPGLSLIPFVPSALNIAGIVLAFKAKQE